MELRLLAALLLLSGCAGESETPNGTATTGQIERLSTPGDDKQDPLATVRLQPIAPGELEQAGLMAAGCTFSVGDRPLLAAVGGYAVVKLQGELRHLVHSAPVGPSGGFFEDRQISVSVGRTEGEGVPAAEGMAWPARIAVTNRRAEIDQAQTGTWSCGA